MMMRAVVFLLGLCLFCPGMLGSAPKEWQELKGQDFIIYYREKVPLDFTQTVMDSAEVEFKRVSQNLGITRYQSWAWEKRASIFIYSDEEDYVKNGGQAGWSHGVALIGQKRIQTYPSAHGFFDSTLPHELGHLIFRELVGTNADIPLWFEEGIAMRQEKAKRFGVDRIVKTALKNGKFIPLSNLSDMQLYSNSDGETVNLFYAESASVVNFLLTEFNEQHFYKLCRVLKENTSFVNALPEVYMRLKSVDVLNKLWVKYLEGSS